MAILLLRNSDNLLLHLIRRCINKQKWRFIWALGPNEKVSFIVEHAVNILFFLSNLFFLINGRKITTWNLPLDEADMWLNRDCHNGYRHGECYRWSGFKFQDSLLRPLSHKYLWEKKESVSSIPTYAWNSRVDWAL